MAPCCEATCECEHVEVSRCSIIRSTGTINLRWHVRGFHVSAAHEFGFNLALWYSRHYKSNYYTSDMAVTVAVSYCFNTGLEMYCVCIVCVCLCVWLCSLWKCEGVSPAPSQRDGWGGGATESDLHLLIELSPASCHNPCLWAPPRSPIIHHASAWHRASLAGTLMAYEVFWVKLKHFYMIWNIWLNQRCTTDCKTNVFASESHLSTNFPSVSPFFGS